MARSYGISNKTSSLLAVPTWVLLFGIWQIPVVAGKGSFYKGLIFSACGDWGRTGSGALDDIFVESAEAGSGVSV